MARMQHQRWCAERRLQGWKRGVERDNDRKLHPELVLTCKIVRYMLWFGHYGKSCDTGPPV